MIRLMMLILIPLIAAALIAWPVITWWNTPDSHTFKNVLQGVFRDSAEICKPAIDEAAKLVAFVQVNACSLGVFLSGLVSLADPTLRNAILTATWHGVPVGGLALLLVTWLATLKPVTPPARR